MLNQCSSAGPTGVDVELMVFVATVRDVVPQVFMFRGQGFSCPASPPYLPEAFNSTFPPAHHQRVIQLRRFCAHT